MNNGLPGPNLTETVTGGKTLELSKYDKVRRPHKAITDDTKIKVTARTLSAELCCPICLDLLTCTMTTKECLHRFCSECITTALMRGNKECPTCRKKIVSKRSLRRDPNFDFLISKIWPDRKQYDAELNASMQLFKEQSNVAALQKSIEEGIKAQSAYRKQRVQGSYDYEKRKRRPKVAAGVEEAGGGGTTSIEQVTVTLAPAHVVDVSGGSNSAMNGTDHQQQQMPQTEDAQMASSENSADESEMASESDSEDTSSVLSESSHLSSSSMASSHSNSTQQSVRPSPQRLSSVSRAVSEEQQQRHSTTVRTTRPMEEDVPIGADGQIVGLERMVEELKRHCDELEVELVPSRAMLLLQRNGANALPAQLCTSHYIKTSVETTIAAIAEFLAELSTRPVPTPKAAYASASAANSISDLPGKKHQPTSPAIANNNQSDAAASSSPSNSTCICANKFRPKHFYILNRQHRLHKLALSDCLAAAFLLSIVWDQHLLIFFDHDESPLAPSMDGQMEMIVGEEMARNIRSIGNKHGGDGSDKNVTEMGRQQPQQPKHIKMEIKEEVPAEANQSDQCGKPSTSMEPAQQQGKVPKMEVDYEQQQQQQNMC